jgi:hypothetical protein
MIFNEINKTNYMIFAIRYYNNPNCLTIDEFHNDMKKFRHIKKLFNRYKNSGVLKTHLIINHLISLYNLFDDAATPLLFYKIDQEYWTVLKSFLIYLNRYPEGSKSLDSIPVDINCIQNLKNL